MPSNFCLQEDFYYLWLGTHTPNTPALCSTRAFLTSAAEKPFLQKRCKKINGNSELSAHCTANAPGLTPAKERWNPGRLQTEMLGTVALLHLDYASASAGPNQQRCKPLGTHVGHADWLQILGCLCTFKWRLRNVLLLFFFFLPWTENQKHHFFSWRYSTYCHKIIDRNVVESAATVIWWSKIRKSISSIIAFVPGKQVEKRLKMVAGLEVIQRLLDWKAGKGQSPTGWWWQVKHLQAENHFDHKRAAAAIWGARKIRNDPYSSYTHGSCPQGSLQEHLLQGDVLQKGVGRADRVIPALGDIWGELALPRCGQHGRRPLFLAPPDSYSCILSLTLPGSRPWLPLCLVPLLGAAWHPPTLTPSLGLSFSGAAEQLSSSSWGTQATSIPVSPRMLALLQSIFSRDLLHCQPCSNTRVPCKPWRL